MYVVLDTSKCYATTNQLPPKFGHYSFLVGENEVHYANHSLKDAVNEARRWARSNGVFRVIMTKAVTA